jgi:hypothetical protein
VFIDPEIGIVLADYLTGVDDLYWFLLFDREAESLEFYAERILVNFLEKPRTESVVDLISATDDFLRKVIILHEPSNKSLDRIYTINKILQGDLKLQPPTR